MMPSDEARAPGTLVVFHAHPDDEAIMTAGTMARASAAGHRVVLVVATRGELGDPLAGAPVGAALGAARETETLRAAQILGVARVAFLDYTDSGMDGKGTSADPFASADVDEAARRLAVILAEEAAEVLTVYDDHGGYGHPDHVQVHHVGIRAAALAGTPRVYEATVDRDRVRRLGAERRDEVPEGTELPDVDAMGLGVPGELVTTRVDVRAFAPAKRAAMAAHSSQITPDSFFLALPDEPFLAAFGWEEYIRRGSASPDPEDWLFA